MTERALPRTENSVPGSWADGKCVANSVENVDLWNVSDDIAHFPQMSRV